MPNRPSPDPAVPIASAGKGTLRVAILAYPGTPMPDVTGPLEVFSRTSRWLEDDGKRADDAHGVEIVGLTRGPFRASSGPRIYADRAFADVGRGVDTLMIAGGTGSGRYRSHPALLRWIRRQAGWVRRLASICPGAFFLAEAGLLNGRRATTHSGHRDDLAREFPAQISAQLEAQLAEREPRQSPPGARRSALTGVFP